MSGTFHKHRFKVASELSYLQTGDILFRFSDARFKGIPYSKLVCWATKSKYSHSSVVLRENDEVYVVEVNDQGCQKMRLIDWISLCFGDSILVGTVGEVEANPVLQLKVAEETNKLYESINNFLDEDSDFDFTFDDPSEFYCVEATHYIFFMAGIDICTPMYLKDIVNPLVYGGFKPINVILKKVFNAGMPLDKKLYFVGNKQHGMLASPNVEILQEIRRE